MISHKYKLSVITVNRNNAEELEKTIVSVVNQTFNNYEYIVIDGASTDDSVGIIKKYSDRIHYWISENDSGIYNAMNKGIKQATGKYLIFMNSGDRFVNEFTLKNVFSKNPSADILVGAIIRSWKLYKERSSFPKKTTFYNVRVLHNIPHQSTFIKRELFFELGFYDESKLSADYIFSFLAIFKYNKSVLNLEQDIAFMDTTGISNTEEGRKKMAKDNEEMLQEHFPYFIDDYIELTRLKRFTLPRIKNKFNYILKKILIPHLT